MKAFPLFCRTGLSVVVCVLLGFVNCTPRTLRGLSTEVKDDRTNTEEARALTLEEEQELFNRQQLRSLSKALKQRSDDVDIYYHIGLIESYRGEWPKAIKAFKQVINIDPDYVTAYYQIGMIWEQSAELYVIGKGRTMGYAQRLQAIDAYQDALRADPDYADAYYRLGLMALMEKDMPLASQAIEGLSRLEPDSARSRELLRQLADFYGIDSRKRIDIKKRQDRKKQQESE